jgi:hypothetical protein
MMTSPLLSSATLLALLTVIILIGQYLRSHLPDHHLAADSRDGVKLALGLVATMTALLLGLLVSSAKGTYDTVRSEVIQMAAKAAFLDRALVLYGHEADDARAQFRLVLAGAIQQMWPATAETPVQLTPNAAAGDALYVAIQRLTPRDDIQHSLKTQATALVVDIGQLRTLLQAQSLPSISHPLLLAVVCWLLLIFLGFSLVAPPNATTTLALIASAFSVAGAIFLILELDHPLSGLISVPSDAMVQVFSHLAK